MNPTVSVIICSHNPNANFMNLVLKALREQTLTTSRWELIIIDSNSDVPLTDTVDVSWHANANIVREEALGLTPARLRGIAESSGTILVFVDDDNVLQNRYLDITLQIEKRFPFIGAWGGQIIPKFEVQPPDWFEPYIYYLTTAEFQTDTWSNLLNQRSTVPSGAGLCVRNNIAKYYQSVTSTDSIRLKLDRMGTQLLVGGDIDLAYMACLLGYGTGLFHQLELFHLIPEKRLTFDFILRAAEGGTYSATILTALYGGSSVQPTSGILNKIRDGYRWLCSDSRRRQVIVAEKRGFHAACKFLEKASIAPTSLPISESLLCPWIS